MSERSESYIEAVERMQHEDAQNRAAVPGLRKEVESLRAENERLAKELESAQVETMERGNALATYRAAIDNSGMDISPCRECGELVVCVPDGLGTMCERCAGQSTDG